MNSPLNILLPFEYVVPEGSRVILDAREFTMGKRTDNTTPYDENKVKFDSYEQTDKNMHVDLTKEQNDWIYSFKAPYVRGENRITTTLNFKLSIIDKNTDNNKPVQYDTKVIVKRVHRAIIFQGGVALGAYEAGVFQALVKKLGEEAQDSNTNKEMRDMKRPLFDIVAGTSIGAMNAAIVASSVIRDVNKHDIKTWENAVEKVRQFWNYQKYNLPTVADSLDANALYHFWWETVHVMSALFKRYATELLEINSELLEPVHSNFNPSWKEWSDNLTRYWFLIDPSFWKDYFINGWYIPAAAEAARRYYSSKQFKMFGAPNVATGIPPWSIFGAFFDFADQSSGAPRVDNKHFLSYSLKETLGKLAHFPIEIEKEQKIKERQPRFLLVTVDVKTGDAVTFDSYSEGTKYHEDKNSIHYEKGIEVEYALASGTFPNFFDYPKFRVYSNNSDNNNNSNQQLKNEEHAFWDGGYRSNTPLREVIQAHRDYWHKVREHKTHDDEYEKENDVPDLEVYIADVWPSELKEEPISYDLDFVENRKHDLLLADRTDYDEKVANVVTDYVDLVKRLKNLAERNGASKEELDHILGKDASSKNTEGVTRKYKELLGGRFRLTKVVRIDHKDDGNNVAGKIFDYSCNTIEKLIEEGSRDARIQMDIQSLKDQVRELAERHPGYDGEERTNIIHIKELE